MKKKRNVIFISVAVSISILILALMFMFVVFDKKDFSDTENRNLAEFPKFSFESLLEGDFIAGVEEYLADHFPFRNQFMSLKTTVLKSIVQDKIGELYLGSEGFLLEDYTIKPETTNIPIDVLNRFYAALPEGTNMSLMLVPTSVEVYSDMLPAFSTNTSQKNVINFVYDSIDFNGVNVYDELMAVKKDVLREDETRKENVQEASEQLYYKTDHHWTTFGAYLGYVAYMRSLGVEVNEMPEFEKVTDEFYGTFYSKLIDNSLEKESMYKLKDQESQFIVKNVAINKVTNSLYEDKWLGEKDKYSYFLGQNQPLLEIENKTVENDKKILIVKDSYANAMVPFIAKEYKFVYVIDPRMYRMKVSDYIIENDIQEVLLVYNMKTVETDLGIRALR